MTNTIKTPKPHHATAARAALFSCVVEYEAPNTEHDGGWRLIHTTEDGTILRALDLHDSAKAACHALVDADPDSDEWHNDVEWLQDGDEDADEDADDMGRKCGVMAKDKHDEYEHNPHGPGCGDMVDIAMRDAYTTEGGLDRPAIQACAGQLWDAKYENLNNGMVRMNVSNKIRGFLRNHEDAIWTIGEHTGRFSVAYNPAKRKAKKAA